MANNLPSPEEIARVRAKVAGRPESWEDFMPSEEEMPQIEDAPDKPIQNSYKNPKKTNTAIEDAKRLYTVSDAIYKTLIFFNYVTGISGGIAAIIAFIAAGNTHETMAAFAGIAIIVVTVIICFINYAIAVLATHFAKVLSNISIALLDR